MTLLQKILYSKHWCKVLPHSFVVVPNKDTQLYSVIKKCVRCGFLKIKNKGEFTMNLNEFAKTITLKEGGKKSLSVAQVKEVIKLTLLELAAKEDNKVLKLLKRYKKNNK